MKIVKKIRKKRRKLIRRFFKSPIKKRLSIPKPIPVFASAGKRYCIQNGESITGGAVSA